MENLTTARFAIPLLAAGQAHKEIFHNEAIAKLEMLSFPLVRSVENDPESLSPSLGQSWIVGPNPLTQWANHANALATWTEGGWRFVAPVPKMSVKVETSDNMYIFRDGEWTLLPNIVSPALGGVVDNEARAAIDSILSLFQQVGIIPYTTE